MSHGLRITPTGWMVSSATVRIFNVLKRVRFVGGCVRNTLMGLPINDIDLATPLTPDEVIKKLKDNNIKVVPTGYDHGTVTAIIGDESYEITTLRHDLNTDGRRAEVVFTDNYEDDAMRRDFTINALYMDIDGLVHDYVDGLRDISPRKIRFVGEPLERLREDHLRALRFFRFHAYYGTTLPDSLALDAIQMERDGIDKLSGERIQQEMFKLLIAHNPIPAIREMRWAGVMEKVFGKNDHCLTSIRRLERLVEIETKHDFPVDPILRLAAVMPRKEGTAESIGARWRLKNKDTSRLKDMEFGDYDTPLGIMSNAKLRETLFGRGPQMVGDRALIEWAENGVTCDNWFDYETIIGLAEKYVPPVFPIKAADLIVFGLEKKALGDALRKLKQWWIFSDFKADKEKLIGIAWATYTI